MVALIPARAGSTRVPGKNTRRLNGHPVIAYTIAAARQSGVFTAVLVCTDDPEVAAIVGDYGATACVHRAPVPDDQPDQVWVEAALRAWRQEAFAILRPTSPFRGAATIRRAYRIFCQMNDCTDSLRAVRPVTEHPYKMWRSAGPVGYEPAYALIPLHPGAHPDGTPWHSSPTQSLPTFYVQTSALEMAWTRCVEGHGTIAGRKISPFLTTGLECVTIDTEADWDHVVALARAQPDGLPAVAVAGLSAVSPAV
jgi:N-acylneuraminate cytidylyltransferase